MENGETSLAKSCLSARALLWVGLYSYVIYLVHWPVLVLFRWTVGIGGLIQAFAAALAIGGLSWTIRRWVELPMRDARKRFKPQQVLIAGILILISSSLVSKSIFRLKPRLTLSPINKQIELDAAASSFPSGDCRVVDRAEGWEKLSFQLEGSCNTDATLPRVFVIGDSHTDSYRILFRQLAREKHVSVTLFTLAGCPYPGFGGAPSPDCQAFFDRSFRDLASLARAGDFLFLPGFRLTRMSDWFEVYNLDPNAFSKPKPLDMRTVVPAALKQIQVARQMGLRVILEAPKPLFRTPVFRCADWFNEMNPACQFGLAVDRSDQLAYRSVVMEAMSETQKRVGEGLTIFDPFDTLCPKSQKNCEAVRGGLAIYFDQDHLAPAGVMKLYPALSEILK